MNNNFNSKYIDTLESDYMDELNIIIDMFDNLKTQVVIFNESKPKFLSKQINKDNKIFEFYFGFDNNNHNFIKKYDDKNHKYYEYLITSKNNNTKYSYELLCAEYIQYIINSICRCYGYRYNIPNRLYKVNQITFIVNDAFDLKILDMICKILHNRYVFKYIKRSDCIKNMLTFNNITTIKPIENPNDCVIYVDEHSTYFMKYETNSNNLFTECIDVQHFDYGINDLIKDIQSSIPHIKISYIKNIVNDINSNFDYFGFNQQYDLTEGIIEKYEYDDDDDDDDDKKIKKDIENFYENYDVENEDISIIINNYLNKITEYMNNFFNDKNYNIYIFSDINIIISKHCSQLRQHNVRWIFNYHDIQINSDAINNIYSILFRYREINVPNNLRNLITDEMKNLYNSNNTNDKMFYYEMHTYELYKYFIDGKYIPFINAIECDLSKNLLDMYTFDTIINTYQVMKPSMINMINGLINTRKIKDLIPKTDSNGEIITVCDDINSYTLHKYLDNVENTFDIEVLNEILFKHGKIQSDINNGNQIITYLPSDKYFKDDVMRFIQYNIINVNNFTEYCKRFINNTK